MDYGKLEVVGLEDYWAVIEVDGSGDVVASFYDEQDAIDFVKEFGGNGRGLAGN